MRLFFKPIFLSGLPCREFLWVLIFLTLQLSFVLGQTAIPVLKGDYFGLRPPGKTPAIFAPGIVSTDAYEHSAPAFSPDGNIVLWTIVPRGKPSYFLEMKRENGVWSNPGKPSFTDSSADDIYPAFSPDGNTLYFSTRRKLMPGDSNSNMIRIWEVKRNGNDWGKPKPIDISNAPGEMYAHSTSRDGTIYFSVRGGGGTNWNIYYSRKTSGRYATSRVLPYNINGRGYDDGPFISPDGRFLIFESQRPEGIEGSIDLYICFKEDDGRWSIPENMGNRINTKYTERFAGVSPDGKYLFFGSDRRQSPSSVGADIYWIDAGIITDLKKVHDKKYRVDETNGISLLNILDANNNANASVLLKQWVAKHPNEIGPAIDYAIILRSNNQYADAESFIRDKLIQRPRNIPLQTELILNMLALGKKDKAAQYVASVANKSERRAIDIGIARHYLQNKKNEESAAYFEKALMLEPRGADYYTLAYAYANDGKNDKAIESLERAVGLGYGSKQQFENDPTFTTLRQDDRFKSILEKLK